MKLKQPLAKQLLVWVLLASSLLTFLITSAILYMDYQRDLGLIDQRLSQIEKSHLPPITNALWAEDEMQLELLLQGISELPNVASVAIWQDNSMRLSVTKSPAKYAKRKSWSIDFDFNHTQYHLGELVMVMDITNVYAYLADKVVVTLLTQGAKTFIVSFIIYALVYVLITRHLNRLAYAMSHVNMSAVNEFKLGRKRVKDDEINRLVVEFNAMMAALLKSFKDLKKQKQAEQNANKTKGEFLANISMEVKTPMNGLLGMAHLLSETKLDHRQHSYLNVIQKSAFNMLGLLNGVIDFSKTEQGETPVDQHLFDVHQVTREVYQETEQAALDKRLRLVTYVDLAIKHNLLGDSVRLKQVLTILVNKAIKYSERGEVLLAIDAEFNAGMCELTFSIKDSGPGIDELTLAQINGPESKSDKSNVRMGLSFTIAKNLVSLLGGELHINTKKGLGTEVNFTLSLPISSTLDTHLSEETMLAEKRVLILDNRLFLARYLGELFGDWKMQVTHVQDSNLALDYMLGEDLRLASFDIVLISYSELRDDLLTYYEKINRHRFNKPARLIVFGDSISEQQAQQVMHAGYNQVWQLPMHPSKIKSQLVNYFSAVARSTKQSDHQSLTVLIADDAPISQRVLSAILINRGDHVIIANDGEQALQLWQQHQNEIDLVLMDCLMPKMTGYHAAEQIRLLESPDTMPVPIVAVTSSDREDERDYCRSFGINEVLLKPFLPIELLDIIEQFERDKIQSGESCNLQK